ncbi:hypothetical protein BKA93DRAFT_799246 [Sparassis latifolia]
MVKSKKTGVHRSATTSKSVWNHHILSHTDHCEKKLFQRQNKKHRHELESYQWSVDDLCMSSAS